MKNEYRVEPENQFITRFHYFSSSWNTKARAAFSLLALGAGVFF